MQTIPIIFHNIKNYEGGHHIMTKLGKFKDNEIDVSAFSVENYITFNLKPGCPIQMFFSRFSALLPTSLVKLVKNLETSKFTAFNENLSTNILS